jgi:hypothetical protein
MARRAEMSSFARKSQNVLVATAFTFYSCETAVKVAAVQITMDYIYDIRSPEPIARGI